MKEKQLKRLSRSELLELLLAQTRETERLQAELAEANAKLADRDLRMRDAGDLAQAVLVINGVMEAAQKAADQYLENIAAMEARTKEECDKLISEAKGQAFKLCAADTEQDTDTRPGDHL